MTEHSGHRAWEEFDATLATTWSHAPEFVGLTESESIALAERLGIELRVIRDDHTALRKDLRARRVTVDLRTGTVTQAYAG
jgi:hypothetical protein